MGHTYFMFMFIPIVLFCSNGCGYSGYAITYSSNPTGAAVICEGEIKGFTPVTLYYDFDDSSYYTQDCKAVWVSGATVSYPNEWGAQVEAYPSGVGVTVQRPQYPDFDKDMMFSVQVEQMRMQQAMLKQQQTMTNEQRTFNTQWQVSDNERRAKESNELFMKSLERLRSYR